mmetsp:Transcript_1937/g.5612  ORF Transcript_1937/g.5612 Transcript_1937/m.5612 type:complete len:425 (-) Transcript_1937:27-1301(-)
MALHDHLGVTELLGDVAGGGTGHLDPGLGEEGAGREDEDEVEDGVEGVVDDLGKGGGRADVVGDATDGDHLAALVVLPLAEKANENVGRGAVVQELGDEVDVGNQGRLEDDGHVGGVEELDGVGSGLSTVLLVLDGQIDAPSLEVDDDGEDEDGGGEVGKVGEVLAVDGLLEGADLVIAGDEEMEESDDGSLELSSAASVDGGGTEGLPDNVFTDVGGNEQTDATSEAVSLLKELVEGEDNETGAEQLSDDDEGITGSDGTEVTVHATDNISDGLADRDEDTEELLGALEEGAVLLDVVVHLDDAGASQKLHDQTGRNDGTDAQLHEGAAVRGQDDAHPVERVGRLGALDAVDGDLAAHQEDEQRDGRPQNLLAEGDLAVRAGDLREDAHDGADQMEESHVGFTILLSGNGFCFCLRLELEERR